MRKTLRKDLKTKLHATGEVEALTICFVNAYINGANEVKKRRRLPKKIFGDTPISVSPAKSCRRCRNTSAPKRRS